MIMNLVESLFGILSILLAVKGDLIASLFNGLYVNDPDYGVLTPQLILSRGFGYELHSILTVDGFVLGVHRIQSPLQDNAIHHPHVSWDHWVIEQLSGQ